MTINGYLVQLTHDTQGKVISITIPEYQDPDTGVPLGVTFSYGVPESTVESVARSLVGG